MLPCRRAARLAALLALLAAPAPARAALLDDHWYESFILDRRVGYLHETAETDVVGGRRVVRTSMDTRLTIQRAGTELGVESRATFVETFEGEPLSFESRNRLAASEFTIRAERKGGSWLVTQEALGQTTTTEVADPGDIVFPRAMEKAIAARALAAGARLELRTFSPDTARPTRVTIECRGEEVVEVEEGHAERLWRLESRQDLMPSVVLTEWRDGKGVVRKSSLPILGLEIVSRLTTRERALLGPDSVELMVKTLVDPEVTLPRPRGITRGLYRLRWRTRRPGLRLALPEDERQRIVGRQDDGLVLEVRAESWAKPEGTAPPRPGGPYLRPSSAVQTQDAKVKELARKAAGSGDAEATARSVTRWVHAAIAKKSLSVGLATAAEVARDLTGDCTEHAVLAAALLRVHGIPSKVAMGLVYLDGVFGYHMWTEAWVGRWRSIDPAFGQEASDATHIKLAESALDQGFVDEAVIRLVEMIANLDVRVVEYDLDGRTHETARAAEAGVFRDGSYENAAFGLKLSPPGGWKLKPGAAAGAGPLVRIEGPGGATGEVEALPIGYDFRLAEWVAKRHPGLRVAREQGVAVARKSGVRYVLEGDSRREGLLAFLDRDTLFTVRIRPFGRREEKALAEIQGSIQLAK